MSYTKGPWNVVHGIEIMGDNNSTWVAKTKVGGKQDAKADAKLIASAPDLLESLIELSHELDVNVLRSGITMKNGPTEKAIKQMLKKAFKAIKKAKGE